MSKKLKIDVYRSNKCTKKYLAVPSGYDVTKLQLNPDTESDLFTLCPFKSALEIEAGCPYIALNSDDVIADIERNGYATFGATVSITITEGIQSPKQPDK